MKICLYSPYVPKHFGGGEKYFFDVVTALVQLGHEVVVALPKSIFQKSSSSDQEVVALSQPSVTSTIRTQYEKFFQISLVGVSFISTPIGTIAPWWRKLWWTRQFDVMYVVTDGSLFFSLAKKNIVHIQFPFTHSMSGIVNRLKLANWHIKNTNSAFTKSVVEKSWHTRIDVVHYPMIDLPEATVEQTNGGDNVKHNGRGKTEHEPVKLPKEKIILNVGRFFRQLHTKRQDVLIDIFRTLVDQHPEELRGWKLVLVGGIEDQKYADQLHSAATGYSIELLHQLPRKDLLQLYQRAAIYWHATGFEVDEAVHPEQVEHFGISTIEAMTYGCIPLVVGKGGQKEILEDFPELLWQTKTECVNKTLVWINKLINKNVREQFLNQLKLQANKYGKEKFTISLQDMLSRG